MLTSRDDVLREAMYYEPDLPDVPGEKGAQKVRCFLCPWHCHIPDGKVGICRVRKNEEGILYSLNYARVTGFSLDPIEKKPLKRFYPGSTILSFGSSGCNFECGFCQNYHIAHRESPNYRVILPEEAVALAVEAKPYGNIGLAYTYSEPSVWFEYIMDTAPKIHEAGMKNVLVTNGYLEEEPIKAMLPFIDSVNLDIKGFTEGYYQQVCKGRLDPVLKAARLYKSACHFEVTTLIVPEHNDNEEELIELFDWVAEELGRDTPIHLSRYFPQYKFEAPPTPKETMHKAAELAKERLDTVFLGNI